MNEPEKTIHVSPTGENWEVESDTGTLAQAETRSEAIEAARESAAESDVRSILVRNSDGSVQEELRMPRTPPDQTAEI